MKGNFKSLTDLAAEVERQEAVKNDYIVPSEKMVMVDDEHLTIQNGGQENYKINDYAHGQIATKLGIPKTYYDRLIEVPALRQTNVNAWLNHEPKRFTVRTLDNTMRALLSDRFRPLDNFLILSAFLPVVQEHQNLEVMSNALTETRMYLQFKFPKLEGEVLQGDVVQAGIILTNSEVGAGAVDVKAMIWRLKCINGLIGESVLRKYHVGRRIGENEEDYALFSDETIQSEIGTFKLKLRDVIKNALSEVKFQDQLAKMRIAADDKIPDIPKTVENITKRYMLTENEGRKVITNMVADGNSTRWGLINGITALAHDIESRDKQYEIERLGQRIVDLKPNEWQEIVN